MSSQSRLGLPGKCADGGVPSPSPGSAIEPVAYPVPAPRGSRCLPGTRCLADERLAAAAPAPGSDASSTGDPPAARIALQSSAGWFLIYFGKFIDRSSDDLLKPAFAVFGQCV